MYEKLFSPVHIGRLEIRNRVAMTAMGVNLAAPGGGVNDDIIAFYEARARGGVGLIISGLCRLVDGVGASEPCQLAARGPGDIQGLARLMDVIHKYDTRFFVQLHHPGWNYALGSEQPVAASAVESPFGRPTPRELTVPEIHELQAAFVRGATICQAAGADGVELHGAHGYLINSFLSPYLNRRNDDYGGDLDRRLRFVVEIITAIRDACGPDFPVGVRLSAEEFTGTEGNDLAASAVIAERLEQAGVHFLDISCTCFDPTNHNLAACIEPGTYPQGWKRYMAAEIKRHVSVPVIAVANIKDPEMAEAILDEGCCDLVGVARGHLADPEWCLKARTGSADRIRRCIGCLVCFEELEHGRHVKCSVNPVTGREREYASPARNGAGRTVAIVGGGPAGLTAALVLKDRGFAPVVFEAAPRLGGALNVADKGVDREKIDAFVDSLVADVVAAEVPVRVGEEATVDGVATLAPAGVFVACGARALIPEVPGITGRNVVTAEDVLLERAPVQGDCVVLGGGMTGLETAEVLLKGGHHVTVVDQLPQIGAGVEPVIIFDLLQRMAPHGPSYLPGHRLVRVLAGAVELKRLTDGEHVTVPAGTVVLALGVRPRTEVVAEFTSAFPHAEVMGDAVHGGRIVDATHEAYAKAFVFEPELELTGGPQP